MLLAKKGKQKKFLLVEFHWRFGNISLAATVVSPTSANEAQCRSVLLHFLAISDEEEGEEDEGPSRRGRYGFSSRLPNGTIPLLHPLRRKEERRISQGFYGLHHPLCGRRHQVSCFNPPDLIVCPNVTFEPRPCQFSDLVSCFFSLR